MKDSTKMLLGTIVCVLCVLVNVYFYLIYEDIVNIVSGLLCLGCTIYTLYGYTVMLRFERGGS